nr:globin-coupled sensor protein [Gluconacetobacter sacchari]
MHQFILMTARDHDILREIGGVLERAVPGALDALYVQIRKTPEVKRFFSSDAKIEKAKLAQTAHWRAILAARFDTDYVANVHAIGEVHARIGLTPFWYIGGYTVILDQLLRSVIDETVEHESIFRRSRVRRKLTDRVGSLCKAVLAEIDLTVAFYLEEMEAARVEMQAERERLAQEDRAVISAISTALTALADGDLSYRVTESLPERGETLKRHFNATAERLAQSMQKIARNSQTVMANADGIRNGADSLSRATEQQALAQEEMTATVDQIAQGASETAEKTARACQLAEAARSGADRAGHVVSEAVEAIGRIEQSSQEISKIIDVINTISLQTNMLALNAGVEAARAGNHGRGFAVVATEVRALAQRSADAGRTIAALIKRAGAEVQAGVACVRETGESLRNIASLISDIDGTIATIATASQAQSASLREVSITIGGLGQTTLQNAAVAEQSAAGAHNLVVTADELERLVAVFQLAEGGGAARQRPARIKLVAHNDPNGK